MYFIFIFYIIKCLMLYIFYFKNYIVIIYVVANMALDP